MATEQDPKQAELPEEQSTRDDPPYMGKTIAVLCYGFSAGAALAAVALTWLAVRTHYNVGNLNSSATSTVPTLAAGSAICLLVAGFLFILPSLRERYPWLASGGPSPSVDPDAPTDLFTSRKMTKAAIRECSPRLRRLHRFLRWCPAITVICFTIVTMMSKQGLVPAPLQWLDALFLNLVAIYGPLPLIFVVMLAPSLIAGEIERRAMRAHRRRLKQLRLHPELCPDCDYPIDSSNPSKICPECGFERSPDGAKTP